jgi:hypothetical protein
MDANSGIPLEALAKFDTSFYTEQDVLLIGFGVMN